MPTRIPICSLCRHLRDDQPWLDGKHRRCAAFPGGIPDGVYWGDFDHRRPFPGDNGVRFEFSEGAQRFPLNLWADLPPLEDEG